MKQGVSLWSAPRPPRAHLSSKGQQVGPEGSGVSCWPCLTRLSDGWQDCPEPWSLQCPVPSPLVHLPSGGSRLHVPVRWGRQLDIASPECPPVEGPWEPHHVGLPPLYPIALLLSHSPTKAAPGPR